MSSIQRLVDLSVSIVIAFALLPIWIEEKAGDENGEIFPGLPLLP